MTYVFRRNDSATMLLEMTPAAAKKAINGEHDQTRYGIEFAPCRPDQAHKWVKNGEPHSTALWVDDFGKIRRA